jgi:hypothetical protein
MAATAARMPVLVNPATDLAHSNDHTKTPVLKTAEKPNNHWNVHGQTGPSILAADMKTNATFTTA